MANKEEEQFHKDSDEFYGNYVKGMAEYRKEKEAYNQAIDDAIEVVRDFYGTREWLHEPTPPQQIENQLQSLKK